MTRQTLRKALLAILLLAAASFSASNTPVSEAASNCTYYNNAAHSTVVGRFGRDCCNNQIAWGVKTQYSECSSACLICYPPPR